jgi:ribonuclease HI
MQSESLISKFTDRINDIGKVGQSTLIRLKDAQIQNWEPTNIIKVQTPQFFITKKNFQASCLVLAHKYNIRYQGTALHNIFEWQGGLHPIKEFFEDLKTYKKAIKNLSTTNIMFIDQIIDKDSRSIIDWPILSSLLERNNKGRIPNWYNLIKEKITMETDNKLNNKYINLDLKANHYTWTNNISLDNRIKDWIVTLTKDQDIIWGKAIDKGNKNNKYKKTSISHLIWKKRIDLNFDLIPCSGCNFNNTEPNSKNSYSECTFKTDQKAIKGVKYLNWRRLKKDFTPENKTMLEKNIKKEMSNTFSPANSIDYLKSQPIISIIDLGNTLIHKWILTESYKNQLVEAYNNNLTKDNNSIETIYEFYTDGSLQNRGSTQMSMGSAWIQTSGPNPNTTFRISSTTWPSSSKAETIAIFTALLTIPEERNVKIFTDSLTSIQTYYKLLTPRPNFTKRKLLKITNWSIWTKVMETIQSKKLIVELIKVKAHEGNFFNEVADKLAKEALSHPIAEFNYQETGPILSPPTWNHTPIDIPIRSFLKELNQKAINFDWAHQNRNIVLLTQEIQHEEQYEWEYLWKRQKTAKNITSTQDSKKKSFWIKLAQNELPTLDNLAIRNPKLYGEHQICPLCLMEKETIFHLFTCSFTQATLENIWPIIKIKLIEKEENFEIQEKKKRLVDEIKAKVSISPQEYIKAFLGLIQKEDVKKFKESSKLSENQCKATIFNLFNLLREQFHKDIWNPRCKEVISMEKILGINKKKGKKKKIKPLETSNQRTKRKKRISKNQSITIQQTTNRNPQESISIKNIKDKVGNWIQFGKKWLGF